MAQAIWKGHISFGLVTIPVSLHSAESHSRLDFRLIDERDRSPIGYRKFNKTTGKDVPQERIAKGYEFEPGQFLVLTDEDFMKANVEATQSIAILDFVQQAAIDPMHFERPYYLVPERKAEHAYRLLSDTLAAAGKVGIANVVLHARQHLSCLLPRPPILVLEILRYQRELREPADVGVDEAALSAVKVSEKEKALARRIVDDMSVEWKPSQYRDSYSEDLKRLIAARLKAKGRPVKAAGVRKAPSGGRIIDLMEILERSVAQAKRRGRRKGA